MQHSIHASDAEKTSSRFILDSLRHQQESKHERVANPTPQQEHPKKTKTQEPAPPKPAAVKATVPPVTTAPPPKASEPEAKPVQQKVPWTPPLLPADKKYFRASEVGQLLSVEAHVLRYWQKEFPMVRPVKHGGTHWVYRRRDVETLHLVQHLLYREGLSIREAKKEMRNRIRTLKEQVQHPSPAPTPGVIVPQNPEALKGLVREIKELIQVARNTPTF